LARERTSSALGVCLTERSLRLTLLVAEGRSLFLNNLEYSPLPNGSLIQKLPEGKQWSDLVCWFKSVVSKWDFKADQIVFSFGGGPIFVKQMPASREKDKDRILRELEHSLSSPSEEYVFDFYFSKQMIFTVGMRKGLLDVFKALFQEAGLPLTVIDASPFALFNLAECTGILPTEQIVAILCLEESFALLILVLGDNLLWTESLLYPPDILVESPEELRRQDTFTKRLCTKIRLSLNRRERFYSPKGQSSVPFGVSRILLCGLLAEAEGVRSLLSSDLRCPVDILDPFSRLSKEKFGRRPDREILPQSAFALSTGLAYRGLLK